MLDLQSLPLELWGCVWDLLLLALLVLLALLLLESAWWVFEVSACELSVIALVNELRHWAFESRVLGWVPWK